MLRVNLCYYYLCRWPADRLSAVPATADQRGWLLQVQAEPPPPLPALPWELGPPYCRPYSTQCTTLLALFYAVLHTAGPPTLRSAPHCRPSYSTQCSTLPALLLYAVIHTAGPPLRSTPHCRPPSTQQWSTLPALLLYAAVIFLFLTQFLSHMTQGIILHAVKVFCIMAFGYMYYLVS